MSKLRVAYTIGSVCTTLLALAPAPRWGQSSASNPTYLVSNTPLILLSANDAETGSALATQPLSNARDSITAIRLTPGSPPEIRTVYGTVPSSMFGAPRMAIVGAGRYGIVSNNATTLAELVNREPPAENVTGLVSIIDLASPDLAVVDTIELSGLPQMVVAHPDDRRFFVNTFDTLYAFRIDNGSATRVASAASPVRLNAFDIDPDGAVVLASGLPNSLHVFAISDGRLEYGGPVAVATGISGPADPFTVRISPSGDSAIVLNGNGTPTKGELDNALIVDLTQSPPTVVANIEAIADGLESVAIHPDGHLAVIGCLDDHLAVVDLSVETPRVLYFLDAVGIPEGLEFSPDGSRLFVGLTMRNHIAVYDVDGYQISNSQQVLRTGHHPTALAVSVFVD